MLTEEEAFDERLSKLSHTTWDCKYHLVWIPKWRRKVLYGQLRKHLGDVFTELVLHREARVLEGHLMGDHVHMPLSIPPKYSVSPVVGYVKGKSAIHIARTYNGHRRNFVGQNFWARGYYVSTAGRDEETIRKYIKKQEKMDRRIDQQSLFYGQPPLGGSWFYYRFERFTINPPALPEVTE
jgi:putative transposase